MEDFGDYIYLIVIAIAALTSILGKKKKQASEEQRPMPEMLDLEDIIPGHSEYAEYEEPTRRFEIPSYETVSDFTTLKAKKQVVHTTSHFVGSELTLSQDDSFNIIELETDDDVKKAFIYSEIFNRKYL